MDQRIPKMVQCTPLYIPMLTGVVGAIVLRPLEPLKFDLNESGGDPEDGSVCVILWCIIGPELTFLYSKLWEFE